MLAKIKILIKAKKIMLLAAMILFALQSTNVYAQTLKHVSFADPVYRFLDRAYARGWILFLPTSKPYTERQVYTLLNETLFEFKAAPEKFSQRDIDELLFHIERISGNRFSLFNVRDDNFSASINAAPYATFNMALDTPSDTATVLGADLIIDLTLANNFYLGLRADQHLIFETWETPPYRKFHTPHKPDFNMYTYRLTTGESGFNHNADRIPGHNDLSIRMNQLNQMTVDLNLATISFGRNAFMWGPSQFSNSLLSNTAKPYEYFLLDIPFGKRMNFVWMTGFLRDREQGIGSEDDGRKIITMHKFEFQITDWLMFSIYEAVIYAPRFELAYLNPFSLYYISGVATGDYDNKLGGVDFIFRLPPAVIYLSFYFDDWNFSQLFNPSYFHNQLITTLGVRHHDLIPGLTITAEATYINQWMYTHRLLNGVRRNYTNDNRNLGHVLAPNSYMIYFDFRYDHSLELTYGLSFWFTQHAFGSIKYNARDDEGGYWHMHHLYDPWTGNYRFLDRGIAGIYRVTDIDLTIYAEYRIPHYGVKLNASLSAAYNRNIANDWGNLPGGRGWQCFLTLSARWQAY
ncbi:MAG: capsule assembly Wzi family protein [Spirochaetaceae bacterium]|nr:capsule assembly Wzi family protein [Spirochaetaceae bacterium]